MIRLERQVYNNLEDFCKIDDGEYKRYRKKYLDNLPYYSHNIKVMFEKILEAESERKMNISHHQSERLFERNESCKKVIKNLVDKLELVRQNELPIERLKKIRNEWQNLRKLALRQRFSEFEEQKLLNKYKCTFETDHFDHLNQSLWIQRDTLNILPPKIDPDSSFYEWRLNKIFEKVNNHPILRGHFDFTHFEYGILAKNRFFTPYFYQSILAGAIGEEAVKAIFKREKIALTETNIDNTLFELIDLKIVDKPWYSDAKNYGETTIQHFEITDPTDYFYQSKLNSEYFKKRAKEKWDQIRIFHKDEASKLIYINIFGEDNRPVVYYDKEFNSIGNDFNNAKIIIVPNILKKGKALT